MANKTDKSDGRWGWESRRAKRTKALPSARETHSRTGASGVSDLGRGRELSNVPMARWDATEQRLGLGTRSRTTMEAMRTCLEGVRKEVLGIWVEGGGGDLDAEPREMCMRKRGASPDG